jgi:hypothetical protein
MWCVAGTGERTKIIERILKDISKEGKEKINKRIIPHFEEIVSDNEFYEKYYHLWFPRRKQLLTLEYEHCCTNLVALAPKNYWCEDQNGKIEFKSKGVSTRGNLNQHLKNIEIIKECIFERKIIPAQNFVLKQKEHKMTKQILNKTGISGLHTKMICLENQSCLPFIYNKNARDYSIKNSEFNTKLEV